MSSSRPRSKPPRNPFRDPSSSPRVTPKQSGDLAAFSLNPLQRGGSQGSDTLARSCASDAQAMELNDRGYGLGPAMEAARNRSGSRPPSALRSGSRDAPATPATPPRVQRSNRKYTVRNVARAVGLIPAGAFAVWCIYCGTKDLGCVLAGEHNCIR